MADTPQKQPKEKPVSKKETKQSFSLPVYTIDGTEEKMITLSKEFFGAPVHEQILNLYIRVYLQNQRQGTASTKTRSEVIGSTRKIYRQKGTGRARHGSNKAPIFVGGGVTMGPKPRDYSLKMNKKQKRIALISSLSQKFQDNAISLISNTSDDQKPKTKSFAELLKKLNLNAKKTLLISSKLKNDTVAMSARNIPKITLCSSSSVNPYILLNHEKVIFMESALEELQSHSKPTHEN